MGTPASKWPKNKSRYLQGLRTLKAKLDLVEVFQIKIISEKDPPGRELGRGGFWID
jgi:hypothetical protein